MDDQGNLVESGNWGDVSMTCLCICYTKLHAAVVYIPSLCVFEHEIYIIPKRDLMPSMKSWCTKKILPTCFFWGLLRLVRLNHTFKSANLSHWILGSWIQSCWVTDRGEEWIQSTWPVQIGSSHCKMLRGPVLFLACPRFWGHAASKLYGL